jgi:hypothetical protein
LDIQPGCQPPENIDVPALHRVGLSLVHPRLILGLSIHPSRGSQDLTRQTGKIVRGETAFCECYPTPLAAIAALVMVLGHRMPASMAFEDKLKLNSVYLLKEAGLL